MGLFWCNLVFIPQVNYREKVHIMEKILSWFWVANKFGNFGVANKCGNFGVTSMQNNDILVC